MSAREAAARLPDGLPRIATVDLDATVVESGKRSAFWAYTGVKGYQPVVAVWAEGHVILATEFRDGNVPADKDPLTCARLAFKELPGTVAEYGFRGDGVQGRATPAVHRSAVPQAAGRIVRRRA